MGVSESTVYNWRKKYGGLGPSELKRLKMLEAENARLKRIRQGTNRRSSKALMG